MSKRRLGKGLGAFFPDSESYNPQETAGGAIELPLEKISANPHQPRRDFDQEKLKEMADTMEKYGVIQPVIVQKRGDRFILVAGERRLRAAHIAGLKTIPALVRDYPAEQLMAITLIENLQREDLNPVEEASALQKLIQEHGLTQEELAAQLGKSRSAIANTLRLLSLDPLVQNYLEEGVLSAGQARPLLSLESSEQQREIAAKIVVKQLSVRQVESLVRALKKQKKPAQAIDKPVNSISELVREDIQEKMRRRYGTKILIKGSAREGKIELYYYSDDDLERLVGILLGEKNG